MESTDDSAELSADRLSSGAIVFLPVRIRGVSHHREPLMHLSILINELLLELTKGWRRVQFRHRVGRL